MPSSNGNEILLECSFVVEQQVYELIKKGFWGRIVMEYLVGSGPKERGLGCIAKAWS